MKRLFEITNLEVFANEYPMRERKYDYIEKYIQENFTEDSFIRVISASETMFCMYLKSYSGVNIIAHVVGDYRTPLTATVYSEFGVIVKEAFILSKDICKNDKPYTLLGLMKVVNELYTLGNILSLNINRHNVEAHYMYDRLNDDIAFKKYAKIYSSLNTELETVMADGMAGILSNILSGKGTIESYFIGPDVWRDNTVRAEFWALLTIGTSTIIVNFTNFSMDKSLTIEDDIISILNTIYLRSYTEIPMNVPVRYIEDIMEYEPVIKSFEDDLLISILSDALKSISNPLAYVSNSNIDKIHQDIINIFGEEANKYKFHMLSNGSYDHVSKHAMVEYLQDVYGRGIDIEGGILLKPGSSSSILARNQYYFATMLRFTLLFSCPRIFVVFPYFNTNLDISDIEYRTTLFDKVFVMEDESAPVKGEWASLVNNHLTSIIVGVLEHRYTQYNEVPQNIETSSLKQFSERYAFRNRYASTRMEKLMKKYMVGYEHIKCISTGGITTMYITTGQHSSGAIVNIFGQCHKKSYRYTIHNINGKCIDDNQVWGDTKYTHIKSILDNPDYVKLLHSQPGDISELTTKYDKDRFKRMAMLFNGISSAEELHDTDDIFRKFSLLKREYTTFINGYACPCALGTNVFIKPGLWMLVKYRSEDFAIRFNDYKRGEGLDSYKGIINVYLCITGNTTFSTTITSKKCHTCGGTANDEIYAAMNDIIDAISMAAMLQK